MIYNFFEYFLEQYDKNININLLFQDKGETKKIYQKYLIKFLKFYIILMVKKLMMQNQNKQQMKINMIKMKILVMMIYQKIGGLPK